MNNLTTKIMNIALAFLLAGLSLSSALGVKEIHAASLPTLFNAYSIWNQKIPAGVSGTSVGLGGLPVYLIGPDANGSTPVYEGSSSTPVVTISGGGRTFQVPLDPSWKPDPGSDGKASIIDGSRGYSFYRLNVSSRTAEAMGWGDISSSGDGVNFTGWGGRASGQIYLAGLITHDELASGVIPHALAISLPVYMVSPSYVWPAVASDGSGGSIPMGARLQLDPSVAMPTDPAARAIYQALKDYGAWVVDTNSDSIQFYAQARITSSGGVDSGYYSGLASGNTLSSLPAGSLRRVSVNQSSFYIAGQPCSVCSSPTPAPVAPTAAPAPTILIPGQNLLSNPGFEKGSAPWASWQSNITISNDFHSGSSAASVTYVGGSSLAMYSIDDGPPGEVSNPTVGAKYNATAWVKGGGSSLGKPVRLVIRENTSAGETEALGAWVTLSNSWQQLAAARTVASAKSTLDIYVIQNNAAAGDSFLVDDFYLSNGSAPAPSPTNTPSPTTTMTPSPSPTATPSPAPTITPAPAPSPSPTPTPTPAPVPPANTNLLSNPGFESGISPWGSWQAKISLSSDAHSGSKSALVAYTGGSNMYSIGDGPPGEVANPQKGSVYNATVWVKGTGSSIGKQVRLTIRETNGTGEKETAGPWITLTSGWQQLWAIDTIANTGMTGLDIYIVQKQAVSGNSFLVDDLTLTRK